jgi:hypothetical protein
MEDPAIRPDATVSDAGDAKAAATGILSRVPATSIDAGSSHLPTPADGETSPREVLLHVPDFGVVRITYVLNAYKIGRSRKWHWHWRAVRADPVDVSCGKSRDLGRT